MPHSNEHAAILQSPTVDKIRINRTRGSGKGNVQGLTVPTSISVIWHIQLRKGKETLVSQELRFPVKRWTAEAAKSWLVKNKIKYKEFEIAESKKNDAGERLPCFSAYVDKTKKQLDIILHDEIGFWGTQSKEFYELLAENKDVVKITVDINSNGGSVFDGFSIYNGLKGHPATVDVKISGIAASIASVIAMAGDIIEIPENAMLMIHRPYIPSMRGDADELRKQAEALDKIEDGIVSAYRSRMDKTDKEIKKMMYDTTWFSAAEALDAGLVDKITEEIDVDNYHDLTAYNYGEIPETVLNRFDIEADEKINFDDSEINISKIDKLVEYLKYFHFKKESDIMADKELENKIIDLDKKVTGLEKEKTELNKSVTDLTAKLAEATAAATKAETDERMKDYKTFVETLIGEGKVKPADKDIYIDNMEMRFQADIEDEKTPKLDKYKEYLGKLPVVVPVGDRHVADKKDKPPEAMSEDAIQAEVKKKMEALTAAGKKPVYKDVLMSILQSQASK